MAQTAELKTGTEDDPIMLARQPIFGPKSAVYGYELLYRGPSIDAAYRGSAQSARVLSEAIANFGIERIVGGTYMFVNFDQELLEGDFPSILPAGQGVAEILESVRPTPRVSATLAQLRADGICIALDDFLFQENLEPFLKHADYVKVDVLAAADSLEEVTARLRKYKTTLIAEKVETREQLDRCAKLGFQFFQGYFFARPELLKARPLGASQMVIIALIGELQRPDGDAEQLAEKIACDVGLAHQVLKLASSAAFRRQRALASILDAVVVLGQEIIQQWASMLLLSRLGTSKPVELLSLALIRGRMCQAIGLARRELKSEELFTVGLLSVLDALLDRPMDILVGELPLSMTMRDALCGNQCSFLGGVLRRAVAYETGDWDALESLSDTEKRRLVAAYVSALQFARTTFGT